ncbi:cytochrome P450 [Mycena alexandri]|uniref:Cytochrome P450 n=1 Tax=Mycena alexandri TaxID=1745969 RepID=A0AAD6WVL3_9AGAR|nr:cytochrome P450 [Mycena alexandri]
MAFTPGVRLVSRPFFVLCLLLAVGYAASIPPHLVLLYAIPVVLALSTLRICQTRRIMQHLNARKYGARLVPIARARWVGNLDILTGLRRTWNVAYPFLLVSHSNTVNLHVGWDDYIFTTEPEYIKIILAMDFTNYVKGRTFNRTGVFNSDGDMWKFHRGATRPFFNRDRISDFEIFAHHADRAIGRMKERMHAGYAVNFQDLAGRFTMDSASSFLFGSCVDSLAAPLPYPVTAPSPFSTPPSPHPADVFTEAYNAAITHLSSRSRFGWIWPLFELTGDATDAPMRIVDEYLEPIIAAAVARKDVAAADGATKGEPETLLDELLNLTLDPKVLKDEMLNILIAGRDTTMSVLTFIVYFLSVYPDVCTRLRAEILECVGAEGRPTYDDIRKMKYLRAVINETMRLYPPVPSNLRQSINATTWPSVEPGQPPLYIPAGTKISYGVFLMHRRTDLWGPTAESFDPDRFLDARLREHVVANPYCFLPFNAGPRVCLGQQFAYNEISFMLIRLLQSFSSTALDVDAGPPDTRVPPEWRKGHGRMAVEQFRPRLHLTMSSEGGLWVRMTESTEL